ncbi:MAG: hypothetical protein HKN79_08310, partial [Flavobacteriales bacterium]|nr:hypothetical protein [Flavobacteriales bacterium]
VEIGANSIRTWGLDQLSDGLLDEAHEKGLSVMLGLWVGHERHGFDYDDPVAVRKQFERFERAVRKYKDHPALLVWGVGNEVDLFYSNTKVWDAVQDIAAMIHELDPHHPTTTVTAGLDPKEVELILEKAPDIDIYSVNTYGDIANVPANIREYGWDGPYMITEWGVNGHWESPTTDFGVPIEQTSHEKAVSFDERYDLIENDSRYCIGSYAFLWGSKQETTSTWYGLFTPDGHSGEAIDVLQRRWGSEPENRAPVLKSIEMNGKSPLDNVYVVSGDLAEISIDISDPDGDRLSYKWSVISESTDKKAGGDAEKAPPTIPGTVKKNKGSSAVIRAPREEGQYRVFVFATDGKGHAGTANIPFYVTPRPADAGPARGIEFKSVQLDVPKR